MRHLFHHLRGGRDFFQPGDTDERRQGRRHARPPFGDDDSPLFGGHHERGRGHGGWWGDEHAKRGRAGRLFEQGDLRFLILALIGESPRYGYEVIKAIGDKVGGSYSPSPGVVYPTLTLLEEMGLATVSPGEGSKKLYTITEEGRAHLNDNTHALRVIEARLEKLSSQRGWEPPASIIRAMENLRLALRLRLKAGAALSPQEVRAITDALDAAARAVEQGE